MKNQRLTQILISATASIVLVQTALAASQISVNSNSNRVALVELYTSEGCSSCPSADQWLSALGAIDPEQLNVVPLAFHVDYWNYLGWEDPFSNAANTLRQRERATLSQQRTIYTPEFMVDGRETRGTRNVIEAIQSANQLPAEISISLEVKLDGSAGVTAGINISQLPKGRKATAFIALYENMIVREIAGGENSGRTLKHDFVVRHWAEIMQLGNSENMTSQRLMIPDGAQSRNLGLAVVVIDRDNGETLQVISTPLDTLFNS